MSKKQFEPTRKKLQKAKKEGKVPYSRDILSVIQLSICFLTIKYISSNWHLILDLYHKIFIYGEQNYVEIDSYIVLYMVRMSLWCLGSLLLGAGVITVCTELSQKGLVLSVNKLKPSLEHVNPCVGLKRILHLHNGEGTDIRGLIGEIVLLSLLCVGINVILGSFLYRYFGEVVRAEIDTFMALSYICTKLIQSAVCEIMLLFGCIGIVRYLKSAREVRNELKMTLEEFRKELKEDEGDPHTKNERKAIYREITLNHILETVKKARVIITD